MATDTGIAERKKRAWRKPREPVTPVFPTSSPAGPPDAEAAGKLSAAKQIKLRRDHDPAAQIRRMQEGWSSSSSSTVPEEEPAKAICSEEMESDNTPTMEQEGGVAAAEVPGAATKILSSKSDAPPLFEVQEKMAVDGPLEIDGSIMEGVSRRK